MKVLEPGRVQKGWSVEATCSGAGHGGGGCQARLLVERGDLFRLRRSEMGGVTNYVSFRCPECGANTDLASSDNPEEVPAHVWESLKNGVRHPDDGWCHPNEIKE